MSLPHHAHTVSPGEGKTANLGVAQMRVLAAGKDTTETRPCEPRSPPGTTRFPP